MNGTVLGTLFGLDYDLLLYDVTSTYFEGEAAKNPQAVRGYSRDHRPDCQQVNIALYKRVFCYHAQWISELQKHFKALSCNSQLAFDGLVTISIARKHHNLRLP